MSIYVEMFQYPFMVRAFLVGTCVALCASLLGVSLVLKRYAMIGDALSHVGFGALALASTFHLTPMLVCIPTVGAASFLLLRMKESSTTKGDGAIALLSSSSLAIGVFAISYSTGMNTDVCNYMFGSILSMTRNEAILSVILSGIILVLYFMFYHYIFTVTFDESFAKATGIKANRFNMLIAGLTSIVIVLGLRMMGALLISSFIVFPVLTSMKLFKNYKSVCISSAIISVVCLWLGLTCSYILATPTGASVVIVDVLAYIIALLISKGRNLHA